MNTIKRFEEMLNEEFNPRECSISVLDHLKDGDAILVQKEDLDKFYDTLGYYIWITFTKVDSNIVPPVLFFVLIGSKIYHTDKPNFGGQEFTIFEPKWDDLKPYKEI